MDEDLIIHFAAKAVKRQLVRDLAADVVRDAVEAAAIHLLRRQARQKFERFVAARKDKSRKLQLVASDACYHPRPQPRGSRTASKEEHRVGPGQGVVGLTTTAAATFMQWGENVRQDKGKKGAPQARENVEAVGKSSRDSSPALSWSCYLSDDDVDREKQRKPLHDGHGEPHLVPVVFRGCLHMEWSTHTHGR